MQLVELLLRDLGGCAHEDILRVLVHRERDDLADGLFSCQQHDHAVNARGGSDFATKNYPTNRDNAFGGGAGAGVNITPVAFLVVRGESVRMLPVAEPASTSMDRLIEQLPDLLDKAESLMKQKRLAKEEGIE